jgi:hypothetical protein
MPVATSAIIAAASAAASAGQAIAANQRRKKDEAAARDAASRLSGLKETDYSAGLQIPTMGYNLAQQGIQQQEASGLQSLREAGAAGVIGGVPSLVQAGNQANQELSSDLQQAQYNRDLYHAQNQQGIENRKIERNYDIGMGQLQGAQLGALQDKQMVNQGVAGAFSGLTSMGESIAANQDLYKNQAKVETPIDSRNAFKAPSSSLLQKKGTPMINTYGPAPEMGVAPMGTNTFGNTSYAPGYTPYGYYPGLTTPFKR